MAKLNKIIVDSIEYDVGEVQRVNDLPATITTDSPEIIIYNNQLYIKTIGENDVMTYELIKAGSNGTQIEANPELTGGETKLSSIAIDGVNYEIAGGAPITPVEVLPEETEENLNQYKIYEKDGTLNYITKELVKEPVIETAKTLGTVSRGSDIHTALIGDEVFFCIDHTSGAAPS